MLSVGQIAPAFSLFGDDGKTHTLEEFLGKQVILYFYPKDNTPGCTLEAIDFTRLSEKFKNLNTKVIGVSADSFESHCQFRDEHKLSILLLSDPDKATMKAYSAWGIKKNYGKEYEGTIRSTILIDAQGKVEKTWYDVSAKGHAEEVLESLKK